MAAFAYGFRDVLEAALIIGLAVAAMVRLGRGNTRQALWIGVGGGALLGFSIATGLAAAQLTPTGSGWLAFEIVSMALSVAALLGLALTARRFSAESGPALWLAVATGLFAALPQMVDVMGRVADGSSAISLAALLLGGVVAAALAALVSLALQRMKLGGGEAAPVQPVSGELAAAPVRIED